MLGRDTCSALAAEVFRGRHGAIFPAVTCSPLVEHFLLGCLRKHGIVGNDWYDRDLAEVFSGTINRLVHGERLYEAARQ